ncbi:NIF3 (NGG1p interacting factor 3) [Fictibacillus solisalsi]|uniref:GTP cyclohydrolase 1 type 2 homolog n=1 Tax=Fictibacillus solisalsi TaxID=459525 RepID=A0A1G9VRW1_9BACL|nr:Nif3-like dinuclear metal center hexameric protein [Fictibacillus solisalsi]SDM74843.1 NIF3 (NGG1p interacting factor 3) [Fictibacillus solisalsi]
MISVQEIVKGLNVLTHGRVLQGTEKEESHPFVIWKSSGIKGKEVLERPGLVYGDPKKIVKKLAVSMTLSEQDIELAAATGVDAIIAHHPIADGASSGGVTLRNYLDLYGIAIFELHEAFHGLHPGIPFLHGHKVYHSDIHYGNKEGNVLFAGRVLPEVKNLGDVLDRLEAFMNLEQEKQLVEAEREIRGLSSSLIETSLVTCGRIEIGTRDTPIQNILHIFPHTGFSIEDLRRAKEEFPQTDTVIASISRVSNSSSLVRECYDLGLNFLIGNCHVLEIYENGLPLAYSMNMLFPEIEVVVFRERVTSVPVAKVGNERLKQYAKTMAENYLVKKIHV